MTNSQPPDPSYEYQKELHANYRALRSEADRIAFEMGGRYEKMLSLVSGGAMAVSITFIEKIAPTPLAGTEWIALAAWLLLGGSIIATLFAIAQSQEAQQRKIENLDLETLQRLYPNDARYAGLDATGNPFASRVLLANRISFWGAVAGLLAIVFFAFLNFPSPKQNEPTTRKTPATESIASPGKTGNEVLRADKESNPPSASTIQPASEKIRLTMPSQTPQPSSTPPSPPQPIGDPRTTYTPSQNPIAPPAPPPGK